ncbi:TIGR04222 domain-containing membrane protein [Streptomyces qinzhouensis]|uniref:TIGR04222 domain-containing membrane protein n=1 Tax=Streptomyces qinzhouensis TaxID=2599401 RepID=A0A5B8IPS0_9ACTN|nr:TIGR04222 domain-containing membrane protein [Streptomyces qinzhouensis]QDY79579.1 TIGR04222 domain-containing membrane protein [Streptomyces qinzhouensis]
MLRIILLALAWAAAGTACVRLCRAAVATAPHPARRSARRRAHQLTLPEAAFLAGGPGRVMDVTLVAMHRRRALLLAHTGWATVVDPDTDNVLERSVIRAIGPAGHQARTDAVRRAAGSADAVRAIAESLVGAGLAVPDASRARSAAAVRGVRAAALAVPVLTVAALALPGEGAPAGVLLPWFALPLLLTLSALLIGRVEVRPYLGWASPEGRRLLGGLITTADGTERGRLTAIAVGGPDAIDDPLLRRALTGGRRERADPRTAHRGH